MDDLTEKSAPQEANSLEDVLRQIRIQLKESNKILGGHLYRQEIANQPDGTQVTSIVFDAASLKTPDETAFLVFVEGEGFRKIVAPTNDSHNSGERLEAAIAGLQEEDRLNADAKRKGLTGNGSIYIGAVTPGHTEVAPGRVEYVLPHGVIARSWGDNSTCRYEIATRDDVTALLQLNASAAKQKYEMTGGRLPTAGLNEQDLKTQQETLANVAKQILPNLANLLET